MLNGTLKCRSEEARECGSEKLKARKVVNRYAQRHSKVLESGKPANAGVKSEKSEKSYESIALKDTPKYRSRTVVRLVMPDAGTKQSLLNDTPKCRSGCPK